ncbi:hypothetical protein MRB53_039634 [Persea americana]|nr:hypothetical protein MRB53_039634 [Persea americana]
MFQRFLHRSASFVFHDPPCFVSLLDVGQSLVRAAHHASCPVGALRGSYKVGACDVQKESRCEVLMKILRKGNGLHVIYEDERRKAIESRRWSGRNSLTGAVMQSTLSTAAVLQLEAMLRQAQRERMKKTSARLN